MIYLFFYRFWQDTVYKMQLRCFRLSKEFLNNKIELWKIVTTYINWRDKDE